MWFLYGFLIIAAIVLIVYIIGSINNDGKILTTKKVADGSTPISADQYYFLPTASLIIKATAKAVVARRSSDGAVQIKKRVSLTLDTSVNIEPDTSNLFAITYSPFAYANDELKIDTDPDGLLENVSSITEDRIGSVIAEITDAATTLLPGQKAGPPGKDLMIGEQLIIETYEFNRSFTLGPDEIKEGGFQLDWQASLGNPANGSDDQIDLSITGDIQGCAAPADLTGLGDFPGLLTRPMTRITVRITEASQLGAGKTNVLNTSSLLIPDRSKTIGISIRRFSFVKNQFIPKFKTGLLIENYINKPSQAEAFASIPIRILKAVFAIPAELFNFKISHIKQESSLDTELLNLKKAQDALAKGSQPAAATPAAAGAATAAGSGTPAIPAPVITPPTLPQLGKLPAQKPAAPLKKIGAYLNMPTLIPQGKTVMNLGAPPAIVSWQNQAKLTDWNAYQNLTINDCVPAAAAHLIMSWTANAQGQLRMPPNADVLQAYSAISNYNPQTGANNVPIHAVDVMTRWRDTGIGTDKIDTFIPLIAQEADELRQAVYLFGGCIAGLQMPNSAKNQNLWVVPASGASGDGAPNSWGGHAVAILGYDDHFITCITWGKILQMTWSFYLTYNDESFAPLSQPDWINSRGLNPAGIDFNTLNADLKNFGF
jgi:hypothetical protein